MKNRLRNLDAVHAERDELIQQLETTKQELFHEQKKARTTIEELKEVPNQYIGYILDNMIRVIEICEYSLELGHRRLEACECHSISRQ